MLFSKAIQGVIVDTSGLIDETLTKLVSNNLFIKDTLLITDGVLDELQSMADQSDKFQRKLARRGLKQLQLLQKSAQATIRIIEVPAAEAGVDRSLVDYCQRNSLLLYTADHNLELRALTQGIGVINPRKVRFELSDSVQVGDRLEVEIIASNQALTHEVRLLNTFASAKLESSQQYKVGDKLVAKVVARNMHAAGEELVLKPLSNSRQLIG